VLDCWSNFVGHSVHKMPVTNSKFMFQRVYDSLPTSVFERVGVLRELFCVRSSFYYWVLMYDFHILNSTCIYIAYKGKTNMKNNFKNHQKSWNRNKNCKNKKAHQKLKKIRKDLPTLHTNTYPYRPQKQLFYSWFYPVILSCVSPCTLYRLYQLFFMMMVMITTTMMTKVW